MVGCFEDAQLIGEWDNYFPLPDGWGYLDEGAERAAYISPDNVVYKVELRPDGSNTNEYFNICTIKECEPVEGWDVPDATLYDVSKYIKVIAMEYVKGKNDIECHSYMGSRDECDCEQFPCTAIGWEMIAKLWGVRDLTAENVRVVGDTRVLIDVSH